MSKSKIFFWLSIAFILGIAAGELLPELLALGLLVLGIIITALNWPKIFWGILIIIFALGAYYFIKTEPKFYEQKENIIREKIENRINKILPEPQASLLAGILLGRKRFLSENLIEKFNRTSTTHILVVSGYNITIIAALIIGFLNLLTISRKYSFWLALLGIIGFVWLIGPSPPVIRAMIMGILILLAIRMGRIYNITNALLLAAILMLLYDPSQLVHNISFQLSFAATIGIVYLYPRLRKLGEILGTTLSAQIAVFPFLAYYFGQISLISPLANLLVLPAVPLAMLFGALGIALGEFFTWPAWLFLAYIIKAVELLASLPFAAIQL